MSMLRVAFFSSPSHVRNFVDFGLHRSTLNNHHTPHHNHLDFDTYLTTDSRI
jgi:hypothetical protein